MGHGDALTAAAKAYRQWEAEQINTFDEGSPASQEAVERLLGAIIAAYHDATQLKEKSDSKCPL